MDPRKRDSCLVPRSKRFDCFERYGLLPTGLWGMVLRAQKLLKCGVCLKRVEGTYPVRTLTVEEGSQVPLGVGAGRDIVRALRLTAGRQIRNLFLHVHYFRRVSIPACFQPHAWLPQLFRNNRMSKTMKISLPVLGVETFSRASRLDTPPSCR